MKFNLNQFVALLPTGRECGVVRARSDAVGSICQYLVRYVAADGRLVEQWWPEDALVEGEPGQGPHLYTAITPAGVPPPEGASTSSGGAAGVGKVSLDPDHYAKAAEAQGLNADGTRKDEAQQKAAAMKTVPKRPGRDTSRTSDTNDKGTVRP